MIKGAGGGRPAKGPDIPRINIDIARIDLGVVPNRQVRNAKSGIVRQPVSEHVGAYLKIMRARQQTADSARSFEAAALPF